MTTNVVLRDTVGSGRRFNHSQALVFDDTMELAWQRAAGGRPDIGQ